MLPGDLLKAALGAMERRVALSPSEELSGLILEHADLVCDGAEPLAGDRGDDLIGFLNLARAVSTRSWGADMRLRG